MRAISDITTRLIELGYSVTWSKHEDNYFMNVKKQVTVWRSRVSSDKEVLDLSRAFSGHQLHDYSGERVAVLIEAIVETFAMKQQELGEYVA
jgi:hypothetical protein